MEMSVCHDGPLFLGIRVFWKRQPSIVEVVKGL